MVTTSLPASLLQEGENDLTVTNVGDTGVSSFVFLDRVHVVYPETAAVREGLFEGVFPESGVATVQGSARYALDVTSPQDPLWLVRLKRRSGQVRLRVGTQRSYLLTTREALRAPRISKALYSTLRQPTNQADYVVIAPEEYLEAAEPLLQRRRDQGLVARGVSFEEITSEFGYGRPSPEAIRDFLAYAYHSWQRPSLRYVLLLGDSSYDPREHDGSGPGGAFAGAVGEDVLPVDVFGPDAGGDQRRGPAPGRGDRALARKDAGGGRGSRPEGAGLGRPEPGGHGGPRGGQPGPCWGLRGGRSGHPRQLPYRSADEDAVPAGAGGEHPLRRSCPRSTPVLR